MQYVAKFELNCQTFGYRDMSRTQKVINIIRKTLSKEYISYNSLEL
jgi:hypothetical protein